MPDIWMDVDTAITIPVNKVPIVASSDGYTIDETIAYNESGMDLNWNFVTTAGVQTQTNVSPTSAGDYDWTHVGNGMYKIEMTASAGASADNDTEGFGWFSGKADAICPFAGPTIGFRAAALNNALIDGGDNLQVDVTHIMNTILTESGGGRLAAAFIKLFDVATPTLVASSVMRGTDGANTVEPDATGTAAGLHATTDAKIDTTDGLIGGLNNVSVANLNTACDTVTVTSMANDVITAASINTGAIAADAVASTALDNVVMSDLAQGAPSATASIVIAINVLYEAFRNKTETTATLITIMKDNGTTALMKSTISDDTTTFTKDEFISGA